MVWYGDYWHYRRHLRRITEADYVALARGPVIDDYENILSAFVTEGLLRREEVPVQGHPENPKIEYVPLMEPDESLFLETEIEVLNQVIRECGDKTGTQLTERTHREGPWVFTWSANRPGQRISDVALRWLDNLPSESDLLEAKKAVSRAEVAEQIKALTAAA